MGLFLGGGNDRMHNAYGGPAIYFSLAFLTMEGASRWYKAVRSGWFLVWPGMEIFLLGEGSFINNYVRVSFGEAWLGNVPRCQVSSE